MQERDPQYIETADIIAIRDAVIALTTVVLPRYRLIWGGHPSITPLIYHVMEKLNLNIQEHVTLYQSRFFEKYFPKDNNKFKNIVLTDIVLEKIYNQNICMEKLFSVKNMKKITSLIIFLLTNFIGSMVSITDVTF